MRSRRALRRHDGVYRWFLIRVEPFRDESGRIVRWYGTSTDIEDRKQAERKLREEEHELRQITDVIRQAIVVLDADGAALYANRVALDLTGLTVAEVSEKGFFTHAFHPADLERVREVRTPRLSEGVPFGLEMRALLRSGQYRWYLNQYNPLKDERGHIIRWYVTGTDISTTKRGRKSASGTRTWFCGRKSTGLRCYCRFLQTHAPTRQAGREGCAIRLDSSHSRRNRNGQRADRAHCTGDQNAQMEPL